jgi:phytoene dehydrogenase-like protein
VDGSCDVLVIGAGHNGLVTAAYLARAGLSTLVLERRERVGGSVDTSELVPGVRVPTVAHTIGRLWPSVIAELELERHGLELIHPEVLAFAPQSAGESVTLWRDVGRSVASLATWSPHDARAFPQFDRLVRSLGRFLSRLSEATPPDLKNPSLKDAFTAAGLGRAYKGLDGRDAQELLRILPMAVADLVAHHFSADSVRGLIATRGVQYAAMGPWSAGTAGLLLSDGAVNDGGAAGQTSFARGGPGALGAALASSARAHGAQVRTEAEVSAITTQGDRAIGVALSSGEEIKARAIVASADPKRVLLKLVDPVALGPHLSWRAGNIRAPGVVAKVNLAVTDAPRFTGATEDQLQGRIVIAPSVDYLEQAFDSTKYGEIPNNPYLEATIPSLADPSLASEGRHCISVIVQYVPYHLRSGDWEQARDRIGDSVISILDSHAPGLADSVIERQVLTPLDLEREYGLTEGHPLHAEPGLDQFFAWRPLLGHARYRLALDGLYLCGSGAHPGGGVTGGPGRNAAREILSDLRTSARTS